VSAVVVYAVEAFTAGPAPRSRIYRVVLRTILPSAK
jgi:hypothetical protein